MKKFVLAVMVAVASLVCVSDSEAFFRVRRPAALVVRRPVVVGHNNFALRNRFIYNNAAFRVSPFYGTAAFNYGTAAFNYGASAFTSPLNYGVQQFVQPEVVEPCPQNYVAPQQIVVPQQVVVPQQTILQQVNPCYNGVAPILANPYTQGLILRNTTGYGFNYGHQFRSNFFRSRSFFRGY